MDNSFSDQMRQITLCLVFPGKVRNLSKISHSDPDHVPRVVFPVGGRSDRRRNGGKFLCNKTPFCFRNISALFLYYNYLVRSSHSIAFIYNG
jgi:hypothetical protein